MGANRNPFDDIPMKSGAISNPFDDIPSVQQPTKAEKIAKFKEATGIDRTAFDVVKNIAVGLEKGGQNIASTLTGGYAPKVDAEQVFGIPQEKRMPLVQGMAQFAPLAAAGPLGFVGDLAAGTAYGATQAEPGSRLQGAGIAGGSNAAFGLLNTLTQTSNPIVRALARSLIGGSVGYAVGGKEGLALGAGSGIIAPSVMSKLGVGKTNPVEDLIAKVTPQEYSQAAQAGLRLGTPLSVGEASGRPDIMASEAGFGRVGQEGVTQKVKTGQERIAQQKAAINLFKQQVTPEGGDAALAIRDAANTHIAELKQLRSDATAPHYKAAESERIPQDELDTLLQIPRIKNTFHEVLNDPELVHELGGVQPTGKKMIAMVENRIDNLISQAKSKPYNKDRISQLEFAKNNFENDPSHPQVQSVLQEIYSNDPVFQATAQGIDTRSVKFLDTVKKRIDTAAENMASPLSPGKDRYKAGLIKSASDKITDVADRYSPSYNQARAVHAQMSPMVDEAESGVIGRLAQLKDTQLKNASKMIFDPSQTNLRVLGQLKKQIMRRDPSAWDSIVKNEIERITKKGDVTGVQFYNNVLSNDNQFKHFELALDHNPVALQTLRDMKVAWKNLSNIVTPKTAKGRAETSMDTVRQSFGAILEMVGDQLGGKRHAEAIKYLYSPRWVADAQNIRKTLNKKSAIKQFSIMTAKIIPPALLLNSNQSQEQ